MKNVKIFVGFTTRPVPEAMLKDCIPEFEGNKGTNDPEKIQAQIENKRATWLAEAKNMPYTGTFDKVCLSIHSDEKQLYIQYKHEGRYPFGSKPSISAQIAEYLNKHFPDGWGNKINSRKEHDIVFVGFNTKLFLKMLGLECASPAVGAALPVELWYGNSDHRGIEEALLPFTAMGLKTAIAYYRVGLSDEDTKLYDELFTDWTGPGQNADKDVKIALHFAAQLGFLRK